MSTLGGFIGIVVFASDKKIYVGREYIFVVTVVALVAIYSSLIVLLNAADSVVPALRSFRALISTMLLGLVFYNLSENGNLSALRLSNILIVVLLVNALVILASILRPEIKETLAVLYAFDKHFVNLRGFGLTAGYDTAGYLCVFGAILSSACMYYKGGFWYSLALPLFILASIFTSRSTIALAGVLMVIVSVVFMLKGRWALKIASLSYMAATILVAVYYVLPLILSTFDISGKKFDGFSGLEVNYTHNFAATDVSDWYDRMWILPENMLSMVFGTGDMAAGSDHGYVRLIFMIGVIGLLLVILIYLYMFVVLRARSRLMRRRNLQMDAGERALMLLLTAIILLMFVINIKNLYFLTRAYHELIVILFFFVLGFQRRHLYLFSGREVDPNIQAAL